MADVSQRISVRKVSRAFVKFGAAFWVAKPWAMIAVVRLGPGCFALPVIPTMDRDLACGAAFHGFCRAALRHFLAEIA